MQLQALSCSAGEKNASLVVVWLLSFRLSFEGKVRKLRKSVQQVPSRRAVTRAHILAGSSLWVPSGSGCRKTNCRIETKA
jgi:hypothetical protein